MVDTLRTWSQISHSIDGFCAPKPSVKQGSVNSVKASNVGFSFRGSGQFGIQNGRLLKQRRTFFFIFRASCSRKSMTLGREGTYRNSHEVKPVRFAECELAFEEAKHEESNLSREGTEELPLLSNDPNHGIKDYYREVVHGSTFGVEKAYSGRNFHFLEERDEGILSERILSLSRSNKLRSLLELYASMEKSGLQPNLHACNSLVSCLVRNGLLDDALRVFERMKKEEMASGHTYSLILKAIANERGCISALEMFEELEREEKLSHSCDIILYNTMMTICGKMKHWQKVEQLWRRLKQDGCKETRVTYNLLVSAFVQCDQTELALDAAFEMVQSGWELKEDILKGIISCCAKDGKWMLALKFFNQMLNAGLKPNSITYNAVINCLGKAGEVDLAFRVYDHLKSSGQKDDSYTWNALLTALYRVKRYGDALQLFERIRKDYVSEMSPHLYNMALRSCQKLGRWERALQLLWQMERLAMAPSTTSYNFTIGACERARKPEFALQVYQHMMHRKCMPDTFTYASLIRACIAGSLWSKAEEILDRVGPNASLYNLVIQAFCSQGKIISAKRLYMKMRSHGLHPDDFWRPVKLHHIRYRTSTGKWGCTGANCSLSIDICSSTHVTAIPLYNLQTNTPLGQGSSLGVILS
ncbi:pentatricopeptide repeat-containing protein At3g29290-like isoform X2 [Nymphaea colorata]|uniref:pentatricopeptide repeat-containing protein At3g29290-like isoform X2 n=1 Tax=Nymphaea colorata TaxID=210225 RepID=UPI00129D8166|nr:pentatricopeptide repeat-containing protein At3g29290-like isoform X2 [Nymphaea colorata]